MSYDTAYHQSVHEYLHDEDTYRVFAEINRRRYFADVGSDHSIFEFACGLGQNLYALPAATKLGYEISQYAVDFCQRKGLTVVRDLREVPTGAFDIVISRHSLEHLDSPLENLRVLRSFLKPEGELFLILPEEPVYMPRDFTPDINNHLYSWTPRTIANLLFEAGYKVTLLRRVPNSGLKFFAPIADRSYSIYKAAIRLTDLIRRVPGEWLVRAIPSTED